MIAGIDFSTHAVDVVLLDEDSDAATWHRFELAGQDAFERSRSVAAFRNWFHYLDEDEHVIAIGIEEPRGYNAGSLYRIQGAILACLPRGLLVQPWIPSSWRKTVGLPGNASKEHIRQWAVGDTRPDWPQDACDAYCIALATRTALEHGEAAA